MMIAKTYVDYLSELNKTKTVLIEEILYHELTDINYELEYDDEFQSLDLKPIKESDLIERGEFIREVKNKCKLLDKSIHTRKFVIQKKYQFNENLASCISLVQFIIRENKLYTYIFVRSQHLNNYFYDNQTYMKLVKVVSEYTYKLNLIIMPIKVHITSLHIEAKDAKI